MVKDVIIRGDVADELAMHQRGKGDYTKHWSDFLNDLYSEYAGFNVVWTEEGRREIHISEVFWEECECGFQHVLEFAHLNNLEVIE